MTRIDGHRAIRRICAGGIMAAAALLLSPAAHADAYTTPGDFIRMTCSDFLSLSEKDQLKAVYYFDGWNSKGNETAGVAADYAKDPVKTMQKKCQEVPDKNIAAKEASHDVRHGKK
jgi:hypothetical protein